MSKKRHKRINTEHSTLPGDNQYPKNDPIKSLEERQESLELELMVAKELGPLLRRSEERLLEANQQLWQLKEDVLRLKNDLDLREKSLAEARDMISTLERGTAAEKTRLEDLLAKKNNELKSAREQLTLAETNRRDLAIVRRKLKESEERLRKALKNQQQTQETISFQLGYALTHSHTSFRSFISLPWTLWRISQEASVRRKKRKARLVTTGHMGLQAMADERPYTLPVLTSSGERLRLAVIMDQFTYNSYTPEADITQLTPDKWADELAEFKPDFIFVESAWEGKDGRWKTKISGTSDELRALFAAARKAKIPSVFWNKEDPVHYGTFLQTAMLADYVFTTDADCIPQYKKDLGHQNVFLLPFAAQPLVHNPIEKFDRKKSFNFAGSYYLRYPERQRDFEALVNAAKGFLPVEIYDRNFGTDHPHYLFPAVYAPMILGTLNHDEIDQAYKGYEFGININTIKQSQTMFARRAFELLASNTLVISNYSHGLRLMLGDLVLSSDNERQLSKNIRSWLEDDIHRRKLRLLGLRKIMSEHTYWRRLQYLRDCLGDKQPERPRAVYLLADPKNMEELAEVKEAFERQLYKNKHLVLMTSLGIADTGRDEMKIFKRAGKLIKFMSTMPDDSLFGVIQPQDYYGPNYLFDLVQAFNYSNAAACGKKSFYEASREGELVLMGDGGQYRFTDTLSARASLIRWSALQPDWLSSNLTKLNSAVFQTEKSLAIDEFNYIKNGGGLPPGQTAAADDLRLASQGISLERLEEGARRLPDEPLKVAFDSGGVIRLDAAAIYEHVRTEASSGRVRGQMEGGFLLLRSTLGPNAHKYLYFEEPLSRKDLNLETNSQYELAGKGLKDLACVFVYLDADGNKLAHTIQPIAGKINTLPIPMECTHIRLGFRITGPGKRFVKHLDFGTTPLAAPALLCDSPYLVLTKQYPAYDDIYRYGFLHSRVKAYKDQGLAVNVFRICTTLPIKPYHEFEGIEVTSGTIEQLQATLKLGQIKHILVHILDRRMWAALEPFLDDVKVTVWVHGSEIQPWQRRAFEFKRFNKNEIERQKKLSGQRMELWRKIMQSPHPNVTFVFVSNIFKNQCLEDIGLPEPSGQVEIIHNYIDGSMFDYKEKKPEDRLRILSIRPYASNAYANDLTVKTILELSGRPFFQELFFHLVGDGDLFEEITAPVKGFENVKLDRRFIPQWEISELHKEYGVFLVPTRMDTQGVSRDEAMSSGLVPITNLVASIPEFIDDDCALTVPGEDYKAMADAVEKLYHDPDLFLQLSRAAAERVRQQSGFDQTIRREMGLITTPVDK